MVGSVNFNIMMKVVCKVVCGLVKDFGEVENLQVLVKLVGDFVSCVDVQVEVVLKEELLGVCLIYGWLGEEGGG